MAEEIKEQLIDESGVPEQPKEKETDKKLSLEEQVQQLMLENAKLKRATDKATAEASSFKKQLREKQSADEIALQEKAEREAQKEEELNNLRRENQINKFEKNYLALGYDMEQAHLAATAQVDGDTDALFKIQNDVQQSLIKAQKAEWMKSIPQINLGVGEEKTSITQEQFNNMGYTEMKAFKDKYPETYKLYMGL